MSLSDLASLGSFVSGVAVTVSLIYLSLQVRQASKHQRAVMRHGIASRVASVAMMFNEPHLAKLGARQFADCRDFSADEAATMFSSMRAMMTGVEDAYIQYRESLLDNAAFQSTLGAVRSILSIPSWRATWMIIRDDFSDDFKAFVDEQIAVRPLL